MDLNCDEQNKCLYKESERSGKGLMLIKKYNTKKMSSVLFSIYLFFYIFLPPIIGINLRVVLTTINILFIIMVSLLHRKLIISNVAVKSIVGFVLFYIIFLIMQFLHYATDYSNHVEIMKFTISMSLVLIHTFSACILLIILCKFYGMTFDSYINYIINAGIIELLLVLFSFFIPSIRNFFHQLIITNSQSELVVKNIIRYSYQRGYGLASNLFDSFGYITSLIISITFLVGVNDNNKKRVVLSLIMLIMPLLNSRSGLLLSLISILIVWFSYFNPRNIIKYIFISILVIIVGFFILQRLPRNILEWIERGFIQTLTLLSGGGAVGVYQEILHTDMQFPKNFLLGAGYDPESINITGIDSGYVQCIWRFGLIGTIFLFFGIIYYFGCFFTRIREKKNRTSFVVILSIFFIYMFKLYGLGNTGANIIVFGLPIVSYYSQLNYATKHNNVFIKQNIVSKRL